MDADRELCEITLLRAVSLRYAGAKVDLGAPRQQAVFALLALRAGAIVTGHEIIRAVWGDAAPASVQNSVYTYVSGLRRALNAIPAHVSGPRVRLESGSGGYVLRVAAEAVDALMFERLIERARQARRAHDRNLEISSIDSALQLWLGEPLVGLPGPFAESQRERLTELRFAALERKAELMLASGRHRELIAELSEAVTEHPYRESLVCLLMMALFRAERTADALAAYRRTRDLLQADLGIDPGPGLQEIHRQVLTGEAVGAPVPEPVDRAQPGHPKQPPVSRMIMKAPSGTEIRGGRHLVGRGSDLTRLERAHDALLRGHGGVLWIQGEAGVGKTALLDAASAAPSWERSRIVRLSSDGQGITMHDLARCLHADPYAHGERDWDEAVPESQRLVSGAKLAHRLTDMHALLDEIDKTCLGDGLTLAVDDVHRADPDVLTALRYTAELTQRRPLLLVLIARTSEMSPDAFNLRALVEVLGGSVVAVPPLRDDEVKDLVGRVTGRQPTAALLGVIERAEGNPAYIHEIIESLATSRSLAVEGDAVGLALGVRTDVVPPPVSVLRRLAGLSPAARAMVRVAATAAPDLTIRQLADLLDRSVPSLLTLIDEVVDASLLTISASGLAFPHPLVTEAVIADMPCAIHDALRRQVAEMRSASPSPRRLPGQSDGARRLGARRSPVRLLSRGSTKAPALPA